MRATGVIEEVAKAHYARGRRPKLYFWRDSAGHEVEQCGKLDEAGLPYNCIYLGGIAGAAFRAFRLDHEPSWAPLSCIMGNR